MCIRDSIRSGTGLGDGVRTDDLTGDRAGKVLLLLLLGAEPVSYTHLRAHETVLDLVCRLLLEKNKD